MTPFRIDIRPHCVASLECLKEQAVMHAQYPRIEPLPRHQRKLAVVGGGPLVARDLPELAAWDGDIWAINSAANWLHRNGVDATFVTVDPQQFPYDIFASKAMLATCCHPSLFKQLEGRDVRVFDLSETHEGGIHGGCTTATRMPALALKLGYSDISFFGCEGSYETQDHVDYHNGEAQELIVNAGGKDYRIETGLLLQCQNFAQLFAAFDVFTNRSGGLLKAMIENPDTWSVVAVSADMKRHLEEVNGKQGMYELPYVAAA